MNKRTLVIDHYHANEIAKFLTPEDREQFDCNVKQILTMLTIHETAVFILTFKWGMDTEEVSEILCKTNTQVSRTLYKIWMKARSVN